MTLTVSGRNAPDANWESWAQFPAPPPGSWEIWGTFRTSLSLGVFTRKTRVSVLGQLEGNV